MEYLSCIISWMPWKTQWEVLVAGNRNARRRRNQRNAANTPPSREAAERSTTPHTNSNTHSQGIIQPSAAPPSSQGTKAQTPQNRAVRVAKARPAHHHKTPSAEDIGQGRATATRGAASDGGHRAAPQQEQAVRKDKTIRFAEDVGRGRTPGCGTTTTTTTSGATGERDHGAVRRGAGIRRSSPIPIRGPPGWVHHRAPKPSRGDRRPRDDDDGDDADIDDEVHDALGSATDPRLQRQGAISRAQKKELRRLEREGAKTAIKVYMKPEGGSPSSRGEWLATTGNVQFSKAWPQLVSVDDLPPDSPFEWTMEAVSDSATGKSREDGSG